MDLHINRIPRNVVVAAVILAFTVLSMEFESVEGISVEKDLMLTPGQKTILDKVTKTRYSCINYI